MASPADGLCSMAAHLLTGLLLVMWLCLQGTEPKDYCPYDVFEATCSEGKLVVMETARYGRMANGRCIEDTLGNIGCGASVLKLLDGLCSGRQECEITNMVATFKDVETSCPRGFPKYLEAIFTCKPAFLPSAFQCQTTGATYAPPPPGLMANVFTEKTNCGDLHHPWLIEVSPTQRINITLYDFGTLQHQGQSPCKRYAVIREHEREEAQDICGGSKRLYHVFLSHGSKIEVSLLPPKEIEDTTFMLQYEAVGCEEPKHPSDIWMKVERSEVILGCYTSKLTWRLTCSGSQWQGLVGNCTEDVVDHKPASNGTWVPFTYETQGKLNFLVAVAAVVITVAVLIVALLYTNRRPPPAINLGSLDEPYEAKDIAFFKDDPRSQAQKESLPGTILQPTPVHPTCVAPRQSCASVPVSTSDSDTYASENATLPLRAMDMDEFESTVQPPLPSKVKQTHKPPAGDLPPPELPPKYPPKVGSGRRANDTGPYTRLNTDGDAMNNSTRHYKTLQMDNLNQSRPLPPVPLNSV